ncbi:MAG: hypothetical protein HDR80_10175 [Bacteroides sp.]|nr:hypothetical protein [Bacteroides sp.]MBD5371487.1 hypothetical protein [Bacteroides sp.]
MPLTLQYSNEDDRAYGLAGMSISLAVLDAIDRVVEVSIDTEDDPMIDFSQDYYFSASPAISPKAVWENLMRNYHLTASMVVSNLMARSLIRLGEDIPADIMDAAYREIEAEGRDTCGLEDDEIKRIYDKILMQNRRIFGNPRLRPAVSQLAQLISRRRRLSGSELRDELTYLQL